METPRSLHDLMRSKFARAKQWLRACTAVQWLLVALAVAGILKDFGNSAFVVVAAFVGSLLVLLLREVGGAYYGAGERLRKLYLLQQGIGLEPESNDVLEALGEASSPCTSEPESIGSYYSSDLQKGYERLLENVRESAFWTRGQAKMAMYVHYFVFGLGILSSLVLALLFLPQPTIASVPATVNYSKLFSTLLLFFVSGSTLGTARAFQSLSTAATNVMRLAVSLLKTSPVDPIGLYRVLSTYDAALAKSPPLPGYTYRFLQKKLNASWEAVRQGGMNSPTSNNP